MTDPIQSAIQVALNGLANRQQISANNLANVQTPNFLAKQTNFEDSLAKALKGETTDVTPQELTSLAPTNILGNNVNLDNETVTALDTNLRYQAMISAMNSKFRILRSAMS